MVQILKCTQNEQQTGSFIFFQAGYFPLYKLYGATIYHINMKNNLENKHFMVVFMSHRFYFSRIRIALNLNILYIKKKFHNKK